jgi:Immunoglobulin-like domain of bacterial spore germination/Sporulation and spore germination
MNLSPMSNTPRDDDQLETRLRRALNSEAAMAQPAGDGLTKIREGIDEGRHRVWWRNPALALVAAAVLGVAVGGLYFGSRDDNGTTTLPPGTSSSPSTTPSDNTSPTPSTSPPTTPSASETAPAAGGSGPVYVYYIGDDGQSPRLYREIHDGVGTSGKAQTALRAMFAGQPDDPDYATPWDNTKLRSYSVAGDTATVDLSKFVSVGSAVESVAVQEIVYTVTANDTAVKRVLLRVKGNAPASGHSDWSTPQRRAPMVDVQGLIWILAPTQGATVSSPVKIDGYGTANEGTISWEVRKNGVVVKRSHTQGGSMGVFGEFHDTVKLPAGDYELTAFESSAKDGSPIHIDTKNFTVK